MSKQTLKEKEDWDITNEEFNDETIRRRLAQLDEKTENQTSFLKILSGILPDCPPSLCSMEVVPVLTRVEISRLAAAGKTEKNAAFSSQREAALAASPYYESAEIIPEGKAGPTSIDASKLKYKPQIPGEAPQSAADSENKILDGLLEKAGLNAADFGTLVHAVLEGRLSKREYFIPPGIDSRLDNEKNRQTILHEAEAMADAFIISDLGKRLAVSNHREPEFPIITSANKIAIIGRIDLLFEEEDEVVTVDFKTDRVENPEDHYGQLAAYYRAVTDIFGKPASVWLYYLRSGHAVDVTEEVKTVPLDEIAGESLNDET